MLARAELILHAVAELGAELERLDDDGVEALLARLHDDLRELRLERLRLVAAEAPLQCQGEQVHGERRARCGQEVRGMLEPAPGEIARVGVGEQANAARSGGDARARGELVIARERGVVQEIARHQPARIDFPLEGTSDVRVHEAAAWLGHEAVGGAPHEIVG
jgi:hypothetical protein